MNTQNVKASDQTRTLRQAIAAILDPKDSHATSQRDIQCTPVFGAYGTVAYWAIVSNGSPPKGAVFIQRGWNDRTTPHEPYPIKVDSGGRTKYVKAVKDLNTLNQLLDLLHNFMNEGSERLSEVIEGPCAFSFKPDGTLEAIGYASN